MPQRDLVWLANKCKNNAHKGHFKDIDYRALNGLYIVISKLEICEYYNRGRLFRGAMARNFEFKERKKHNFEV